MRARKNISSDQCGVAALEFALIAPILVVLILGTIEISFFLAVSNRVEKAAFVTADIVAQSTTISTTDLNNIMTATAQMMLPYTIGANGVVIVTSVDKTGTNPPAIRWQYRGGGTYSGTSQIGTSGTATLPDGFTLSDKENIIITEVYYRYTPTISAQFVAETTLYRRAIYKPRLGALTTLG